MGRSCHRYVITVVICAALILVSTAAPALAPHASAGEPCKLGMHISDLAPGDFFKRHMKRLYAESSTDITNLYNNGNAYITYGRTDSAKEYEERFDHSSYWVQPQGLNQWGLRTSWADTHPGWLEKGLWFVYYNC